MTSTRLRRIFLDLDGVLADFTGHVDSLRVAEGLPRLPPRGDEKKDEAAERAYQAFWAWMAGKPNIYQDLPPLPGAQQLVDYCRELIGYEHVRVLTAIPSKDTMPQAEADKRIWLRAHIEGPIEMRTGPFAKDKHKHCRPGDLLIDDDERNINDWIRAGGMAIHHHQDRLDRTLWVLRGYSSPLSR